MLKVGDAFPHFELADQNGAKVKLSDLKDCWAVFYVYPKDDTPGCTLEGQQFSASQGEFASMNARIFGISEDGVESHKNFCNKFDFKVDLLADTEALLLKALGVGQSDYKGTMYWNRVTFIKDPSGKVAKVYDKVKPDGHDKQVLEDLKELQKQPVTK